MHIGAWLVWIGCVVGLASSGCRRCSDDNPTATSAGSLVGTVAGPTAPVPFTPDGLTSLPVTVTLTNSTSATMTVSQFIDTNFTVTSVSCTGGVPAVEEGALVGFAPPSAYAAAALAELVPKASFAFPLRGLSTMTEDADGNVIQRRYRLVKPGTCRVQLRYEYRGGDAGKPNVVHTPIDFPAFEVTFR